MADDVEEGETDPLLPRGGRVEARAPSRWVFVNEVKGRVVILCRAVPSGKPRCVCGPHWPFLLLSYAVICLASAGLHAALLRSGGGTVVGFCAVGLLLQGGVLISLTLLAIADPGIVEGYKLPEGVAASDLWSYCEHCGTYRPPRTIHCLECRVCVEQYDHHCVPTGKCIGKGNVRFFCYFIYSLVGLVVYAVLCVIVILSHM